jgi:hypothetical protein
MDDLSDFDDPLREEIFGNMPTVPVDRDIDLRDITHPHLAENANADRHEEAPEDEGIEFDSPLTQAAVFADARAAREKDKPQGPTVYHGIMEGSSMQFLDGPADMSDFHDMHDYGQYVVRSLDEVQAQCREDDWEEFGYLMRDKPERQSTFPIMSLPAELRYRIWEIAVANDTPDLVDYCHDKAYNYQYQDDHPWYQVRCFHENYGRHLKHQRSYHMKLVMPGRDLLLVNHEIHEEVRPYTQKRHFRIQASNVECAKMLVNLCPIVKSVAFPIISFALVLDRISFSGKTGVQWWTRYIARQLNGFPDNTISKVVFWTGEKPPPNRRRTEQHVLYHRLDLEDPVAGTERWNIRFTGFFE